MQFLNILKMMHPTKQMSSLNSFRDVLSLHELQSKVEVSDKASAVSDSPQ